MSPDTGSIASRLRDLKARGLPADRYLQELAALADLDDGAGRSSGGGRVGENNGSAIDKVLALRERIMLLEQKVHALESRK